MKNNEVIKNVDMNDELKNKLVEEITKNAGIVTSKDLDNFFLDLQGRMYQSLLNAEINHHVKNTEGTSKNGCSSKGKKLKTKSGQITVDMPRDRDGSFEPIIVQKRKKIVNDFSDFAILLYSKGNSLSDIKSIIKGAYKVDLSESFLSDLISEVSEDVEKWQNRPLKKIYAFMYVDCLYCPVKIDGKSTKVAVYVMLGIDITGKKEVVGIWIGDGSEAASYWTGLYNEIKSRGVEDILYLSMDGLTGLKEGLETVFPRTITQRCIVHLVRNLFSVCNKKEAKDVIALFKQIYQASSLEEAKEKYEEFKTKFEGKKAILHQAELSIEHIYSLFEVPESIRKVIYTTNPIESLNSALRKVTNGKGMFESKESLMRVLYLRVQDLEEKWCKGTSNWKTILNDLIEIHGERITKYL